MKVFIAGAFMPKTISAVPLALLFGVQIRGRTPHAATPLNATMNIIVQARRAVLLGGTIQVIAMYIA